MAKSANEREECKNGIWRFMLYLLSLWLLFFMLIVLKTNVSVITSESDVWMVIKANYVPCICIILILVGAVGYVVFRDKLRSSKELPVTIIECKSINYENLSFLATYVIPLICFPMEEDREIFVMFTVIVIIGCIFVRTNLFYSNPSLVLMGFSIYSINSKTAHLQDAVVIIKGKLQPGDKISYLPLGDNVYFAKKYKN